MFYLRSDCVMIQEAKNRRDFGWAIASGKVGDIRQEILRAMHIAFFW